jgi:hypothetical protein
MYYSLFFNEFDGHGYDKKVSTIRKTLESGNWSGLNIKKLTPGGYYRIALDEKARMLFQIGKVADKKYLLFLEVLPNHEYDKSRFLRGKVIQETDFSTSEENLLPLVYANEGLNHFHVLDKIISFDDVQNQIYALPLPLIVIGSAGSGKTALVLERMKGLSGRGLYVTHSKFLVENSRRIYYSNGYDGPHQEVDFYSFKELLQSVEIPSGKEVHYNDFISWWNRNKVNSPIKDAHKLFEEFRGVLTGSTANQAYLTREQYLTLGVKQSIFLEHERVLVYDYFEKYLAYLKSSQLFELNIESFRLLSKVNSSYEFLIIDEVQDLTNVQIQFALKHLVTKGHWIFCGDSNQIVHPNFFSWSKVKSLFFEMETSSPKEIIQILNNNFRNSSLVTDLANRLLVLKNRRFGSIDKESNYLVTSRTKKSGSVQALIENPKAIEELDKKTKKSTRYAIVVPNEEQKNRARNLFHSPLVFTVHEAKGLEYKSIILFGFFTSYRSEFNVICEGVEYWDQVDSLDYLRAKDKTDKAQEVFKFFVNSLYVGITRAIENLIIVDTVTQHRVFDLLRTPVFTDKVEIIEDQESSLDEWREEALKLEKQGKLDQALEIHKLILGDKKPVPWPVINQESFIKNSEKLNSQSLAKIDKKERGFLLEFAVQENITSWLKILQQGRETVDLTQEKTSIKNRYYLDFLGKNYKNLEKKISDYGVDFPNQFNQSPLHISVQWGILPLVKILKNQGAILDQRDTFGRSPLSLAFFQSLESEDYRQNTFEAIYSELSENPITYQANKKLVKVVRRAFEYFLFYLLLNYYLKLILKNEAASESSFTFDSNKLLKIVSLYSNEVIGEHRKKREYISSILAKNEVSKSHPYNRGLFIRLQRGQYTFNPEILFEIKEDEWISIQSLMGLTVFKNILKSHSSIVLETVWSYATQLKAENETNESGPGLFMTQK